MSSRLPSNAQMLPGSSVWPLAAFRGKESSAVHTRQLRSLSRSPSQSPPPPSESSAAQSRASSRARTDGSDLYRRSKKVEAEYIALMVRKNKLRFNGRTEESNLIQSAVNVGIVLAWTVEDVIDVVRQVGEAIEQLRMGHISERYVRMTEMANVIAEEEILNTDIIRADFAWMMKLRTTFGLRDKKATKNRSGGQVRDENTLDIHQDGDAAAWSFHAPFLLMKIQAALEIAFSEVWEKASAISTTPRDIRQNLDWSGFYVKAPYLLRIPNRECGAALEFYLQNSHTGILRFPPEENDKPIERIMPGIERPLTQVEKADILRKVSADIQPIGKGREMIKIVLDVLGDPRHANEGNDDTPRNYDLMIRAQVELRDEAFLLLAFMYRNADELHGEDEVEEESMVEDKMDTGA
ncbi:hypothetical protein LTR64_000913 [Lithohypha guttulata]|uniref:uncharacterized protein n=1 Tax=Lithohypha guttulata TaxID=1690604 RepID=UPI002DDDFEFF|nr:hypothetical protein LTR51_003107 [Lithohypha guttulata]